MKLRKFADSYYTKILMNFLTFALVPVLILSIVTYCIAEYSISAVSLTRAQIQTKDVIDAIDQLLETYSSSMEQLAEDPDVIRFLENGDNQNYYSCNAKLFRTLGAEKKNITAHVISTSPQIYTSTKNIPREYLSPYHTNWGIFRKMETSDDVVVHVSDSTLKNATNTIFSLGKRVAIPNSQEYGFIIFDFDREFLKQLLPEQLEGSIAVITPFSHVVFSSLGKTYEGYGHLPRLLEEKLAENPAKQQIKLKYNSMEYKISVYKSVSTDFTVIHELSMSNTKESVKPIRTAILTVIGFMLLIAPFIATVIAKNTTAPINNLIALMREVEKGNFQVEIHSSRRDEIGDLENAFNKMTRKIDGLLLEVEEKQYSLSIAETKALQAQINPHFLYNTLDLIKWGSKTGNMEMVSETTIQLGKMLRYLVDNQRSVVTLEEEIDFLTQYLNIQQRRYSNRFHYTITIPEDMMQELIPKLILQPLIENAITHGIENKLTAGALSIKGYRKESYLVFVVEDDGAGISKEQQKKLTSAMKNKDNQMEKRVGLRNIHKRAKLYGDAHCGIVIDSIVGEGTNITLTLLPWEER